MFWYMVPRAGVEPAQCLHRGILSPLRLPISPPGQSGKTESYTTKERTIQPDQLLSTTTPPGQSGKAESYTTKERTIQPDHLLSTTTPPGQDRNNLQGNKCKWRRDPESNRDTRICNPLHSHSAIPPRSCCGIRELSRHPCVEIPFPIT